MSGYVKTFKFKDKNNKLNHSVYEKLLEKLWWKAIRKYTAIWNKIDDLKNIKLNALPVNDYRFIKSKIRTYGDKGYTNFRGLNVPEDDIEWESFTVASFYSLLVCENKYNLQVYLDNYAFKIANKQMADYLHENIFED